MTNSTQLPPFATERLVLRELADSDFDSVHAYASDPVVVRFMPWGPNSESDTEDFLKRAQDAAKGPARLGYELAVVLRENSTLIGAIGLHREEAEASEAMLGYCFGQPAWGRGYATEAGLAMIRFGFAGLKLSSVWAGCDPANQASIRVLEKIGMKFHSRHQHDTNVRGEWRDSLMFRIQSSEGADPRRTIRSPERISQRAGPIRQRRPKVTGCFGRTPADGALGARANARMHKHGSRRSKKPVQRFLVVARVSERMDLWEARGTGEAPVVDVGRRQGLVPGDLEATVVDHDQHQVRDPGSHNRSECAQGHQHATVAVEANHASIRLGEGNAQREVRGMAHRAVRRGEIQVLVRNESPGAYGAHRSDNHLVGAPGRKWLEKLQGGQHVRPTLAQGPRPQGVLLSGPG